MNQNTRGMLPRFLAPALDPLAADVTLPPEESRHLTRVLRLGIGAQVAVFDGRGNEFAIEVTHARTERVTGRLVRRIQPPPEPRTPFSLVQAVLKSHAMDDVVRDATMMGAASVQPLLTIHCAVKPGVVTRERTVERWSRVAVASAKQCRRATIPDVAAPALLTDWLRQAPHDLKLIFVEPTAAADARSLRFLSAERHHADAALIVGPEGGWAHEEIELARRAGCLPVTMGPLTLRADAVAVAAIAVFRFAMDA